MQADGRIPLAAAALSSLLLFLPATPPWSWPAVVTGAVWAPGYALLEAAYPRGRCSSLERHALAAGLGLLLLPIVALATSATLGFRRPELALAILSLTCAAAIAAAARPRATRPEKAAFAKVPSTRATLALCGAAFLLAGAIVAWPHPSQAHPVALWLEDGNGHALALPATVATNVTLPTFILLAGTDAAVDGTLDLIWDGHSNQTAVHLLRHERQAFPFTVPTQATGLHTFSARFEAGAIRREVHFTLRVGSP